MDSKEYLGVYPFLEITTRIGCQNNCQYCPQDVILKAYKGKERELSYENFVKAIDKVPKDVYICFAGFCEPFLNKDCGKMVIYADQKGHKIDFYTTLIKATENELEKIKGIKFHRFIIHLPSAGKENMKADENYLQLLKKVVEYKIQGLSFICHNELLPEFAPIIKDFTVFKIDTISRAGNLGNVKVAKVGNLFCTQNKNHLHQNDLLPNGDVYICGMDFGLKHRLGNLFEEDYASLFNSKEFFRVKEGLRNGKEGIICNLCERAITKNSKEYLFFQIDYYKQYCKSFLKSLLRKN